MRRRVVVASLVAVLVAAGAGGVWYARYSTAARADRIGARVDASGLSGHLKDYSRAATRVLVIVEVAGALVRLFTALSDAADQVGVDVGTMIKRLTRTGIADAFVDAALQIDALKALETYGADVESYSTRFTIALEVARRAPSRETLGALATVAREGRTLLGPLALGVAVVTRLAGQIDGALRGAAGGLFDCSRAGDWTAVACEALSQVATPLATFVSAQVTDLSAFDAQLGQDLGTLEAVAAEASGE